MRQPGNKLNTIYISERVQERLRPARYAALTVLVAPMGYGKTTAVEWYLQSRERDAAAICVRANAYSDSVPLFWDGLCRALERAGFAELAGFPCPEDAAGRALFLELACRTLAGERECVLFLDDFHLLRDRRDAEKDTYSSILFLCYGSRWKLPCHSRDRKQTRCRRNNSARRITPPFLRKCEDKKRGVKTLYICDQQAQHTYFGKRKCAHQTA